jgi:hypothetical protein
MRRGLLFMAAAAMLLVACNDAPLVVHPYDKAPVPAVPDRTQPVTDATPLPDGQYWAPEATVDADGFRLHFTLAQAFFGPGCADALGADQCDDDAGVLAEPSRDLLVAPEGRAPISVVDSQQRNYAVTADELVSLIAGNAPAADAPADFVYTPFPYLLTALNGEVVSIQQIWMP